MTKKKRKPVPVPVERPCDLVYWYRNGATEVSPASEERGAKRPDTELSIGRADSKKALGFAIRQKNKLTLFVLNKRQLNDLLRFVDHAEQRIKA